MPAFIVKPTRDKDFYVRWSTVVDDVTACGSRAELLEYMTKFMPYGEADPAWFDRAEETGTSAVPHVGWFGWDFDEFYLGQYDERRAVKRADLEAYAVARCSDGELDAAIEHTYPVPDEDEEDDVAPTPQPDAERVQGEVTAAVERATEALATDQEHIPWAGHRHPDNWEGHARAALAAALDVEEMARVLHGNPPKLEPETCNHCEDMLRQARALRAALLGSDQ